MLYLLGNNKDMQNEDKAKLIIGLWLLVIGVMLLTTSCSSSRPLPAKRNCHNQLY